MGNNNNNNNNDNNGYNNCNKTRLSCTNESERHNLFLPIVGCHDFIRRNSCFRLRCLSKLVNSLIPNRFSKTICHISIIIVGWLVIMGLRKVIFIKESSKDDIVIRIKEIVLCIR